MAKLRKRQKSRAMRLYSSDCGFAIAFDPRCKHMILHVSKNVYGSSFYDYPEGMMWDLDFMYMYLSREERYFRTPERIKAARYAFTDYINGWSKPEFYRGR